MLSIDCSSNVKKLLSDASNDGGLPANDWRIPVIGIVTCFDSCYYYYYYLSFATNDYHKPNASQRTSAKIVTGVSLF